MIYQVACKFFELKQKPITDNMDRILYHKHKGTGGIN